jgi:shikimate dehydrogenase
LSPSDLGAERARRACVIGWPIEHSRSPLIHGYWLQHHGIAGAYDKQAVTPDDFPQFLRALPSKGYAGANVTVPHKEAAFDLVDRADNAALSVGAVNTIWFEGGRMIGANTDVHGFLANLDSAAPGWDANPQNAAVLGAGGAARAVIKGLLDRGFAAIHLSNRTVARARELAERFGPHITCVEWDARAEMLADCAVLVNTTTLGMSGAPPLDIDLSALPSTATVNDIVYAPLETDLLARARQRGLRAVDGLGMLLHQAAPGFERWFGILPEVTPELRAHILADLQPSAVQPGCEPC